MRNLIKKILKEGDFEWTEDIPSIEFGSEFDEDDITFEENPVYAVNILGDRIIYNLSYEDFNSKAMNGYDDWYLNVLMTSNGQPDYYGDDVDVEEMNYIQMYLNDTIRGRFKDILISIGVDDVDKVMNLAFEDSQFNELEKYIGTDYYSGANDWEDTVRDVLDHIGYVVENNRWAALRTYYDEQLAANNISIELTRHYSGSELIITLPFPYKMRKIGNENISNITDILTHIGDDILGGEWADIYYGEWDSSGAEGDIVEDIERFLDTIEEHIEENEETN